VESSPTIVRYRKGNLQINVYHGRRSYEIDLEIGHDEAMYSISELIQLTDPEYADRYRRWMAVRPESVAAGLDQLAELLKQYGEHALRDESGVFTALESQREAWSEAYALDVLARQLRPKADAAFRQGHYREAADFYEKIRPRLSPVEIKKLDLAKKRSGTEEH
jgi:hypothetical protein